MLDFIDEMMYKLEQEKYQNYYSSAFISVESKLKNIKVVRTLQKLICSYPFDESLIDFIKFEKNNFIGKSKLTQNDLNFYYYNSNYEHIIFNLSLEDKWAIISDLTNRATKIFSSKISKRVLDFNDIDIEMKEMNNKINTRLMKRLDIVAMTTTGACKYRKQLRNVGAKIVMVEEAAEVIEAQIITSMTADTEQLILIGDHQQLKPKVNSFQLQKDYGMEVSLFERLIHLGVPNVQLKQQRRMRPEISKIVKIIYPDLIDHYSVSMFPDVR